jgi:hypothetical protein
MPGHWEQRREPLTQGPLVCQLQSGQTEPFAAKGQILPTVARKHGTPKPKPCLAWLTMVRVNAHTGEMLGSHWTPELQSWAPGGMDWDYCEAQRAQFPWCCYGPPGVVID